MRFLIIFRRERAVLIIFRRARAGNYIYLYNYIACGLARTLIYIAARAVMIFF